MASVRVTIVKACPWQGRTEEFSNVYKLRNAANETPDEGDAIGIINALVAIEKPMHGVSATFVRAYASADTVGADEPIAQTLLSGTGTASGSGGEYRECAVLVQLRLGVRWIIPKWYHCPALSTVAESTGAVALTNASKTPYETGGTALLGLIGDNYYIHGEGGVRPVSRRVYPYLEHRQFHRGKKETVGIFG